MPTPGDRCEQRAGGGGYGAASRPNGYWVGLPAAAVRWSAGGGMAVMGTGTIDGVGPPGAADAGAASRPPARRGRRWLAIAALTACPVVVAAVITGLELGARYQPVRIGNSGGGLDGRRASRCAIPARRRTGRRP